MERRSLGNTGLVVSVIGLGAWQLANPEWGAGDTGEALQVVQEALNLGCNFFDTAPGYGDGQSEELLGQALKAVRHDVTICTKFRNYGSPDWNDFAVAAIRPTLEGSLRRLQTDYVDLLLLHSPPPELMDGIAPQYAELERLKAEGKLRVYGVSLEHRRDLETVVKTTASGAAEVLFNAFDQETLPAFELARARGVGLIVKVPLDSGWLSGKYGSESSFEGVRKRWSREAIERRAALIRQLAALLPPGVPMAHAALQYVLAQPGVTTVIPGAKSVEQIRDNITAASGRLPDDVVGAIYRLWESQIRDLPLGW